MITFKLFNSHKAKAKFSQQDWTDVGRSHRAPLYY